MREDVRLLLSMTGVDIYTALLIKSEVGDINRFPNYKKLVSWSGLAPSLHQSGSVEYHGPITKQGSRTLRWIMVEAARVAVNHDPKLKAFYGRVKHRRGDQKAIVATANKMLKIIWFMLSKREPIKKREEVRDKAQLNGQVEHNRLTDGRPGIVSLDHNIFHECKVSCIVKSSGQV